MQHNIQTLQTQIKAFAKMCWFYNKILYFKQTFIFNKILMQQSRLTVLWSTLRKEVRPGLCFPLQRLNQSRIPVLISGCEMPAKCQPLALFVLAVPTTRLTVCSPNRPCQSASVRAMCRRGNWAEAKSHGQDRQHRTGSVYIDWQESSSYKDLK